MFVETEEDLVYDERKYVDEFSSLDDEASDCCSEIELQVADNIFNFLQSLIDEEELFEEFTTESNSRKHFYKHCLRGRSLKSHRSTVYYDFESYPEYLKREALVSRRTTASSRIFVEDLFDVPSVERAFYELFEGGRCLVFGLGCGFHNKEGNVRLCINAFSSESTTNYIHPTVDFLIQTPNGYTVTLYPIDVDYLETKINNEIAKIPSDAILHINHYRPEIIPEDDDLICEDVLSQMEEDLSKEELAAHNEKTGYPSAYNIEAEINYLEEVLQSQ